MLLFLGGTPTRTPTVESGLVVSGVVGCGLARAKLPRSKKIVGQPQRDEAVVLPLGVSAAGGPPARDRPCSSCATPTASSHSTPLDHAEDLPQVCVVEAQVGVGRGVVSDGVTRHELHGEPRHSGPLKFGQVGAAQVLGSTSTPIVEKPAC